VSGPNPTKLKGGVKKNADAAASFSLCQSFWCYWHKIKSHISQNRLSYMYGVVESEKSIGDKKTLSMIFVKNFICGKLLVCTYMQAWIQKRTERIGSATFFFRMSSCRMQNFRTTYCRISNKRQISEKSFVRTTKFSNW
jgi:hypothetical protein